MRLYKPILKFNRKIGINLLLKGINLGKKKKNTGPRYFPFPIIFQKLSSSRTHFTSHRRFIHNYLGFYLYAYNLYFTLRYELAVIKLTQIAKLCETRINQPITTQFRFSTTLKKKPFENTVRNGESAGNQHFLLFPQCFLPFPKQILNFQ